TVDVIRTDTPDRPVPTPQCTAFPPLMVHGVPGDERSPSKTATVVRLLAGSTTVFVGVAPESVKYCSVVETWPALGFCSVRYSEKKLRVDPSAKYQTVAGAVTPTLSVDPCQDPKLKCKVRSAIPGPGKVTFKETC